MGRVIKLDNDIDYIRKELDELQTRVKSFNVSTQYAISNSDTVAPSTGWQDEKPSVNTLEAGDFIWVRNTLHTSYGNIVLEPYCIGDGVPHIIDIKILYMQSNDPYQAPSPTNINWSETAPTLEAGYYMYSMTVITTTEGETRSSPVRITGEKGDSGTAINIKGDAGKGYDFIYWTDNTAPSTPVGEVTRHNGQVEAWCDYPTPVDATHKYIYMSLRTSDKIGEWGNWTAPVLMSTIGEKGQDGEGFEIIFYQSQTEVNWSNINTNQNPSNIPTNWTGNDNGTTKRFQDADFYLESQGWNDDSQGVDSTYKYEYASHRTKSVTNGVGSWEAFTTPVLWNTYAEDGESTYLHIRYSDVLDPSNSGQVHRNPTGNTYSIGTCIDNTEETDANDDDYDNPSLYSWSKWIPKQGVDYDGKFVFIRYADDENGTNMNTTSGAYLGICYSYVNEEPLASAYTWNKILGDAGEGMNFIYYTTDSDSFNTTPSSNETIYSGANRGVDKWCDAPVSVSENNPYCYISTKPSDSNNWNAPSLWAKYGLDGQPTNGTHGTGYEFAFYTSSTAPTGADATPHDISTDGSTESWQKSVVSVDANHTKVYVSYRTKTGETTTSWSTPTVLSEKGDRGAIGYDGKGIEMVFLATSTEINWSSIVSGATTIDGNQVVNPANENTSTDAYQRYPQEYVPQGWSDDPIDISEQKPFLYSSIRIRTNNVWGAFDQPTLFSRFQKGEDGKGIEFIFRATATNTAPNFTYNGVNQGISSFSGKVNNKSYNDDDFVPNNWADDPLTPNASYPFVWVAQRTSSDGQWSNFSTPTIWSQKEVQSIVTEYYLSTSNTELTGGSWSTTKPSFVTGRFYWTRQVFTFTDGTTQTLSPVCATGEKGEQGIQGEQGEKGDRGNSILNITTAPTSYTTTTDGFTPSYRISISTVKTQSGASEVIVGDTLRYSYYIYPVGLIKDGYALTTNRISIRGATGSQGSAGASIQLIVNYYAKSSTTTAPSLSNFSTNIPTIDATNKYLWNFERAYSSTTPSNDTLVSETDPVIIGHYGQDGATGSAGKGISSIVEEYALSTSTAQPSDSAFSTTVPTLTATKKYLWNRETVNYTTGSPYVGTPKIIGVYGDKGDTGRAIGSVVNYYLATSSGSGVTTSTSGWTQSIQSMNATKQYLWNYEIVKDTGGSTISTSSPVIIGRYGQNGSKGDTGTSIESIVEHYAVHTSNTSAPTTGWKTPSEGDTMPVTTTTNKYLWNYETITYSNPTSSEDTLKRVIGTHGETGAKGDRGNAILTVTTNVPNYTATVDGFSSKYRKEVSVIKSESGVDDVFVGDTLRYSYYLYPIGLIKDGWAYSGSRITLKGDTGSAGASVRAIVNYYAVSSSNTDSSNLTWVTDPSQVELTEENCYLWNYEIAYSHATLRTEAYKISTTEPCVIGTFGEKGDTGSAGKGISSIVEQYALSTTTSSSGLSWKSTVQTPTATNRFLWNKETITYTDNTQYISDPRIIGVYGEKGDSVTGVVNYYLATASSSGVTRSTSGWTDTIQTMTATNKYLWNYEKVNYNNGGSPTYTDPVIIGYFGKEISTITEKYCVTNSTSTPADSSFGTNMVTTSDSNKYLWNYEVITYTDGTSTSTSKRIISTHGTKGDTGATGERGYSILTITTPPTSSSSGWTWGEDKVYYRRKLISLILEESGATEVKIGDYLMYDTTIFLVDNATSSQAYLIETELRGVDGVAPTLNEVADEVENRIDIENLDAKTLGQKSADEYLLAEPSYSYVEQTTSGAKIEYRKLGILVIINIYNWVVRCTETSTSGWDYFRANSTSNTASQIYAPSGFRPSTDLIVGGGTPSANHSKDIAVRLDQDGRFRIKRNCFATSTINETEKVNATFVFFTDNRASTTVSSTIGTFYCGDELVVTLKSGNTNLSGRTVNIEVNNVLYQRTTDSNGQATLKLNNPMSNVRYGIRFMGDKDYATSNLLTGYLTVSKDTSPKLDLTTYTNTNVFLRTTPFKGKVMNRSDKGLKDITVRVVIDYSSTGSSFSGVTDSKGYFTIYHPNDGAVYDNNHSYLCSVIVDDNAKCSGITQNYTITFKR